MQSRWRREFQGVRNPQGLRVGYAGVQVGVVTFRPSQNPYPQDEGTGFGGFFPRVFKSKYEIYILLFFYVPCTYVLLNSLGHH